MNALVRLALVAVLALGGYFGYAWWNSPERQIRRVLAGVEEGLSHDQPSQGVAAIASVAGLREFLAEEVIVHPGQPFGGLAGRQRVLAAAAQLHAATDRLDVDFVDVRIGLVFGGSAATVSCTATATFRDRAGRETLDAREIDIGMALVNGRWVIREVKVVSVLEK
jgi:hypothetical protein